jgi:hypothetical protein
MSISWPASKQEPGFHPSSNSPELDGTARSGFRPVGRIQTRSISPLTKKRTQEQGDGQPSPAQPITCLDLILQGQTMTRGKRTHLATSWQGQAQEITIGPGENDKGRKGKQKQQILGLAKVAMAETATATTGHKATRPPPHHAVNLPSPHTELLSSAGWLLFTRPSL